jgi:ammonium transporter, Amt family
VSGGLAGVISVSAGADVYAPTLGYLLAMASAAMVVYAGNWIEKSARVDDAVGAVAVHGVAGFLGMLWVGVFAAGYPTGVNNVDSSIGGQLIGMATFLPLGFLTGYYMSWVMKKLNILRVPVEVELMGLDIAEYEPNLYLPEVAVVDEQIVEPDGTPVEAHVVLRTARDEVVS